MPNWIIWAIIALVVVVVLSIVTYFVVKFIKMKPEERKEAIITFLIGLVTLAETAFGSGQGKEKLQAVEEQFKKTAPWFLKLVFKLTKCGSLEELVEIALERAKKTNWDNKNK